MAKKKINYKVIEKKFLGIEGFLNVDEINAGKIIMEVEEIGEVDLKDYLSKFNGKLIKLTLTEQDVKEEE